jgi:putative ABC transport system permease protein
MLRFIPYVLKTLWRHRSRTLLTVSGTAVAVFVFCFVGAIQQGMDNLLDQREAKRSLVAFQANKFCPATSHLPQDYDAQILKIDGVQDVVPIQVFTNNCRASLDVVVFYGLPAEKLQQVRDFQLTAGTWADFLQRQDAAVVGRNVAGRRNLNVGDSFSIGEITVDVAGIFSSENPAEENYIYTHLDFLQRTRGQDLVGTVTQLEVVLGEETNAEATARAVDEMFRRGPVEVDTRSKGAFQARSLGDLTQLIRLSHYLGYACVGLMLALVGTTTLMAVQDRKKEHAVLQTIGFSGPRVFTMVVCESLLLGLIGGSLGVATAMLVLSVSGLGIGAEAVTIAFTPSLRLATMGLVVSLATGLLAGLAPACQAARTQIVPALRHA